MKAVTDRRTLLQNTRTNNPTQIPIRQGDWTPDHLRIAYRLCTARMQYTNGSAPRQTAGRTVKSYFLRFLTQLSDFDSSCAPQSKRLRPRRIIRLSFQSINRSLFVYRNTVQENTNGKWTDWTERQLVTAVITVTEWFYVGVWEAVYFENLHCTTTPLLRLASFRFYIWLPLLKRKRKFKNTTTIYYWNKTVE